MKLALKIPEIIEFPHMYRSKPVLPGGTFEPTAERFVTRREMIGGGLLASAALATPWYASFAAPSGQLPRSVAGIPLPTSRIATAAIDVVRRNAPPFLFNHSMRVFLFGSAVGRFDRVEYDPDLLMVGASFHDLGLLPQFSSEKHIFEMDGADAAKKFMLDAGESEERAELVWTMVALHTSDLASHYSPTVDLVGVGASVEFYGAYARKVPAELRAAVVEAFPRLGFKTEIQALLTDYCKRKPFAQAGSWTDVFCQTHTAGLDFPTISKGLEKSPFAE